MNYLSKKATHIFQTIVSQLKEGTLKLDNAPGTFQALSVEFLYQSELGKVYSFNHWGEMNGDLIRDPDVTFLNSAAGIVPLEFQNDYMGFYQEAAKIEEGQIVVENEKGYLSLVEFCNVWMENIQEQQGLQIRK